jgi:hypothetical protein
MAIDAINNAKGAVSSRALEISKSAYILTETSAYNLLVAWWQLKRRTLLSKRGFFG